ncbi:Golgi-associated plant pathogenesis-related protein 1 [Orchesella cincta]|uniref:Golgi-associated plant pathogenesis-related protein 1 n=1 Tax=Orchesella cincta TaxID=48709 RepID=A0A1D2MAA8_ORCCI|nr:Golgi-associated plant pathogenesis-related protein 1 [Orchesella cincta]
MYIDVFKIILLALLTFPSTLLGQNVEQEGCGLRPLKYYLKKSQQRNSAEDEQTELTERENFPWHVSIFRRANKDSSFTYECAGTLIPGPGKDMQVLTAASCVTQTLKSAQVDPEFQQNMRVVVGPTSSNYNGNGEFTGSQKFAVKRVEVNPLYEPVGLKSDAAIIHLDGRVVLGKYAKPACLPPNNIEQNQVRFGMLGEIAGFNWDIRRNVSEKLWYAKYPVTTGVGVLSFIGKTPVSDDGFCENYNIFQRVGPLLQWIKEVQDKISKEDTADRSASAQATTPIGLPPHRLFPGFKYNNNFEYAKVGRDFHNHYRAMHRAGPLILHEKIQESAQRLAEQLASRNTLNVPKDSIYSSNVFALPGVVPASEAVREAVQFWYRSFSDYKRENPTPNAFSQLVWRSSKEVGIGTATDGDRTVVVASYFPKGNTLYEQGKYFEKTKSFDENVKAILPGYL